MRTLLALIAFGVIATAADLSGTWTGILPQGRNGDLVDITFRITQTADQISGKMYRDSASAPIAQGKVTGDQVVFTVILEEQIGNLFVPTKHVFTGTIKGADIEVSRERVLDPKIGNAERRSNQKQTFTLKRLF
jgi:hypothetical protein